MDIFLQFLVIEDLDFFLKMKESSSYLIKTLSAAHHDLQDNIKLLGLAHQTAIIWYQPSFAFLPIHPYILNTHMHTLNPCLSHSVSFARVTCLSLSHSLRPCITVTSVMKLSYLLSFLPIKLEFLSSMPHSHFYIILSHYSLHCYHHYTSAKSVYISKARISPHQAYVFIMSVKECY